MWWSGVFGLYPAQDSGVESFEYRREVPHRRSPPRPTSPSCNVFVSNVSGAGSIGQLCTCMCVHSVHEYVYGSGLCIELVSGCVYECGGVCTFLAYSQLCCDALTSYSVYNYVPLECVRLAFPVCGVCEFCLLLVNTPSPLFSWSTVLVGRS